MNIVFLLPIAVKAVESKESARSRKASLPASCQNPSQSINCPSHQRYTPGLSECMHPPLGMIFQMQPRMAMTMVHVRFLCSGQRQPGSTTKFFKSPAPPPGGLQTPRPAPGSGVVDRLQNDAPQQYPRQPGSHKRAVSVVPCTPMDATTSASPGPALPPLSAAGENLTLLSTIPWAVLESSQSMVVGATKYGRWQA